MKRCWSLLVILGWITIATNASHAQQPEWRLAAALRGSYTTSSKLFFNPDAESAALRAQYTPLDHVYGGGIEFRLKGRDDSFFLALSLEYISKIQSRSQLWALTSPPRYLPVMEGFLLIPIELSGNVFIPLGSETIRLSMGGGVGAYFADRVLKVAEISAAASKRPFGFGIHVRSVVEYKLMHRVSAFGEMHFRDPEVETVSRFQQEAVLLDNVLIVFPQNDLRAKINVDGMSFAVGLIFELM